jgi:hypothetical protein
MTFFTGYWAILTVVRIGPTQCQHTATPRMQLKLQFNILNANPSYKQWGVPRRTNFFMT